MERQRVRLGMEANSLQTVRPGKRERNKAEKRQRIIEAARSLFSEKGFDATTTLEIAERAKVAAGTLFLYARSKEELVALTFRDEFLEEVEATFGAVDREAPFVDQLTFLFGAMIRYHARDMRLAGHLVKQITYYQTEEIGEVVMVVHQRILTGLEELIREQIERGNFDRNLDVPLLAGTLFAFYMGRLIEWVNGNVDDAALRAYLSGGFALIVRGLDSV